MRTVLDYQHGQTHLRISQVRDRYFVSNIKGEDTKAIPCFSYEQASDIFDVCLEREGKLEKRN